ncbi:hypothetical protein IWZ03DRAFT_200969 [Phyllosticta citriasiana]|uniref:Uncharacterized protein n=1 Tax=Phyllosticta citriasiana TaxID=595635 RepID=A0ABR1KHW4_9PEZI
MNTPKAWLSWRTTAPDDVTFCAHRALGLPWVLGRRYDELITTTQQPLPDFSLPTLQPESPTAPPTASIMPPPMPWQEDLNVVESFLSRPYEERSETELGVYNRDRGVIVFGEREVATEMVKLDETAPTRPARPARSARPTFAPGSAAPAKSKTKKAEVDAEDLAAFQENFFEKLQLKCHDGNKSFSDLPDDVEAKFRVLLETYLPNVKAARVFRTELDLTKPAVCMYSLAISKLGRKTVVKKVACERCTNRGKLCVRRHKDGGFIMLPREQADGETLDWNDIGFWMDEAKFEGSSSQ